jgi:hypothetical protein
MNARHAFTLPYHLTLPVLVIAIIIGLYQHCLVAATKSLEERAEAILKDTPLIGMHI